MALTAPPGAARPGQPAQPTPGAAPPMAPTRPAPGGEASRPPKTWQVLARAARTAFEGTPGRLRLAGIATVLAALVFGLFAFVAATTRAEALGHARAAAAQLVRVESIRTNLVFADANLTNAFLVGGLEPASARAAYEQGIATAATTIAEASGNNTHDAAVLAQVNDVLTRYTGLVESARANNRLGFPLGAAYLRQATGLLRSDALPPLADLGRTEQQRVDNAYSSSAAATAWLVAGLVIGLVVLFVAQVWLNVRMRRTFNLPLVAATAIVLVVGLVVAGVMAWSQSKAKGTRTGAYFATLGLASARIDAFDAKSAESLTLIARGQGQAYDASFNHLAANVSAVLHDAAVRGGADESAAQRAFADYLGVHAKIRQADNSGNWDGAVAIATGSGPSDANAVFGRFDVASGQALNRRSAQLHNALSSARTPLPVLAWIALVAGVAAAVAAGSGISTRLREYR